MIKITLPTVPVYLMNEEELRARDLEVARAVREAAAKVVEASPSYDWHRFACESAAAIRALEISHD